MHLPPGGIALKSIFAIPILAGCWAGLHSDSSAGAEPSPLNLLPSDVQKTKALKSIREIYAKDYESKAPADLAKAGRKFLREAANTKDDLAARYCLLSESSDFAVAARDCELISEAVDEMAKVFVLDVLDLKLNKLKAASKFEPGVKDLEKAIELSNAFHKLIDASLEGGRYELAEKAAEETKRQAQASGSQGLLGKAQSKLEEVKAISTEAKNAKKAEQTLETNSEDGRANFVLGRFLCLARGDWEKGIPRLVKGSDPDFKKPAEAEVKFPKEYEKNGDDWAKCAEKRKEFLRSRIKERAIWWYAKSLPDASGIVLARIEKKIQDLERGLPNKVVDLTEESIIQNRLKEKKVGFDRLRVNERPGGQPTPRVSGKEVSRFLYAHAKSRLVFEIGGLGKVFRAKGLHNNPASSAKLLFIVRVDGQERYRSRPIVAGSPAVEIEVALPATAKLLDLTVDNPGDQGGGWSYWCEPRIE
jgi:hypothetical protein